MTATPTAGFAAIFGVFARACLGLGLEEVEEREETEEREAGDEDAVFSLTNLLIPKVRLRLEYQSLRNSIKKSTFTFKPRISCLSHFLENSFVIP